MASDSDESFGETFTSDERAVSLVELATLLSASLPLSYVPNPRVCSDDTPSFIKTIVRCLKEIAFYTREQPQITLQIQRRNTHDSGRRPRDVDAVKLKMAALKNEP